MSSGVRWRRRSRFSSRTHMIVPSTSTPPTRDGMRPLTIIFTITEAPGMATPTSSGLLEPTLRVRPGIGTTIRPASCAQTERSTVGLCLCRQWMKDSRRVMKPTPPSQKWPLWSIREVSCPTLISWLTSTKRQTFPVAPGEACSSRASHRSSVRI